MQFLLWSATQSDGGGLLFHRLGLAEGFSCISCLAGESNRGKNFGDDEEMDGILFPNRFVQRNKQKGTEENRQKDLLPGAQTERI